MAKLYTISPQNIAKVLDLDKIVLTDTTQSITGTKTFTNIELSDKFSIRHYDYSHSAEPVDLKQTIIGYMGDYPGQGISNWDSKGAKIAFHYSSNGLERSDGVCIIRASDGTNITDLSVNPYGSIDIDGKSINDGSFLHVELVNATFNSTNQDCAHISAPYVNGYQFLCWCMYATNGVVEMCYINGPTQQIDATVWMRHVGDDYGFIIGNSITAAALYVRKDL